MQKSTFLPPVWGLVALMSACTSVVPPSSNALATDMLRRLPSQDYALNPDAAELSFSVHPFGFPAVRGEFEGFDGTVKIVDAAQDGINVDAVVDLSSVKFGSNWYETMAKSEAWFDVEHHPRAVFSGALQRWDGEGVGSVLGEITIRGITKPAEFSIRLNCDVNEPCPVDVVGFTGEIELDRTEFGMRAYRGLVGKKVQLRFSGRLTSQ